MDVLFLSNSYYPQMSGVSIVVRYLAEGLVSHGHKVRVATRLIRGCLPEEVLNGVRILRFNIDKVGLFKYTGDIKQYRQFLISSSQDVVIFECSQCVTTDLAIKVFDQISGKKIFHPHGFSSVALKPFRWDQNLHLTVRNTIRGLWAKCYYSFWFSQIAGKFDGSLLLSEIDSSRQYLEKLGQKIFVLWNAADDVFFGPTDKVKVAAIDRLEKPYLLSVANYQSYKNQLEIVRQFYKCGRDDIAMVFIGRSENRYYYNIQKEVYRLNALYGSKDVLMLTNVDRSLIPDIVGHAKLYIVASRFEEFSISLIEAMGKGVPFVSTNVGNARILPGGITVNTYDDISLVINYLLENHELYRRLSEAGREYTLRHCRKDMAVSTLEQYLTELLKNTETE